MLMVAEQENAVFHKKFRSIRQHTKLVSVSSSLPYLFPYKMPTKCKNAKSIDNCLTNENNLKLCCNNRIWFTYFMAFTSKASVWCSVYNVFIWNYRMAIWQWQSKMQTKISLSNGYSWYSQNCVLLLKLKLESIRAVSFCTPSSSLLLSYLLLLWLSQIYHIYI